MTASADPTPVPSWRVHTEVQDRSVHIWPQRDLRPHDLRTLGAVECPCQPRIEQEPETRDLLVIHHSFDGRENRDEREQPEKR